MTPLCAVSVAAPHAYTHAYTTRTCTTLRTRSHCSQRWRRPYSHVYLQRPYSHVYLLVPAQALRKLSETTKQTTYDLSCQVLAHPESTFRTIYTSLIWTLAESIFSFVALDGDIVVFFFFQESPLINVEECLQELLGQKKSCRLSGSPQQDQDVAIACARLTASLRSIHCTAL